CEVLHHLLRLDAEQFFQPGARVRDRDGPVGPADRTVGDGRQGDSKARNPFEFGQPSWFVRAGFVAFHDFVRRDVRQTDRTTGEVAWLGPARRSRNGRGPIFLWNCIDQRVATLTNDFMGYPPQRRPGNPQEKKAASAGPSARRSAPVLLS